MEHTTIPSDLFDMIITFLPERILLNKTWRSRFLRPDPERESLFHLGLTLKMWGRERRRLASHRKHLMDDYFQNLESDNPDPTYCRETFEKAVAGIERKMIDLRCRCERLNIVYTQRRGAYLRGQQRNTYFIE